jgi:nicotinamidase-related amidase
MDPEDPGTGCIGQDRGEVENMKEKSAYNATALLVIDVQNGLFDRSTPIHQADQMLANINTLIKKARRADVPVIFVQHSNDGLLKKGSHAWRLHPAIQPQAGELIIQKLQGNAFTGTDLGAELEKRKVGILLVTGLVTHGCVKATTLGALAAGYRVRLVSDAHSNYSKDAPQMIRKWNQILEAKGAQLVETRAVDFPAA